MWVKLVSTNYNNYSLSYNSGELIFNYLSLLLLIRVYFKRSISLSYASFYFSFFKSLFFAAASCGRKCVGKAFGNKNI